WPRRLPGARVLGLGVGGRVERPLPGRPPALHLGRLELAHAGYALVRYSALRVSTLIRSPGLTNSGTCTTSPVSSVAGLRAPDTRSPWMPGSVSDTVSS